METLLASNAEWHFGNGTFLADLTSAVQTATLSAEVVVTRERRNTGSGVLGLTADAEEVVFMLECEVLKNSEVDKLSTFSNSRGVLMIEQKDSNRVFAMDALVTATPVQGGATGGTRLNLRFEQRATGAAVEGPRVTATGSQNVGTGQTGYLRSDTAIARRTATFNQPADNVSVVGDNITAEGVD